MTAGRSPIYLDHAAATPVDPRVLARFLEVEQAAPGNPTSVHGAGRLARRYVEDARAEVAAVLEVEADAIRFLSGGTEANNTVVRGAGLLDRPVLLSAVEHASVQVAARDLRGVVEWGVGTDGRALVADPGCPVGLICLAHAQGELGSLQPIEAAAALAGELGVPLHVDAAQTLGRIPLDRVLAQADSLALSAHKVGGLRGASLLVVPRRAEVRPLLIGGGQERGHRAGTPSPALAAATALSIQLAVTEQQKRAEAMAAAREQFRTALAERTVFTTLSPAESLPHLLMLRFDGLDGRSLVAAMDLEGVHASQGSACASGSAEPPAILRAIGLDDQAARRCVRFSFSQHSDRDEMREAASRVAMVVERLRAMNDARGA